MNKNRIEAFSDGVFAIILTIMVLELKIPQGDDLSALRPLGPLLFSYTLSFVFVATYWVNHHHTFQVIEKVEGKTLWLNLHLLFWLTLVPFGTEWLTESHFSLFPMVFYGLIMLAAGIAYYFLIHNLARLHGPKSHLAQAVGEDIKGKLSTAIYVAAIPLAFIHPLIAYALYVVVVLIWLVPDPRIEKRLSQK